MKNAPIKEVVLEIILDNSVQQLPDYTILLNQMANEVKKHYPNISPMPGSRIPFGFMEPIIRHRLMDDEQNNLLNFGENVISVNTLSYKGFTQFKKLMTFALDRYFKLIPNPIIKRIGLRYVNAIEDGRLGSNDIFSFNVTDPLNDNPISYETVHIYKYGESTMTLRHSKGIVKEDTYVLDLDYFSVPNKTLSIEEMNQWIEQAHSKIEEVFLNSFKDGYLNG